jgi:hypothetical protein
VVDLGPEVLVDEDAAAGIGFQSGVLQFEVLGLPLAVAEYITVSVGIFLPLARLVTVPAAPT